MSTWGRRPLPRHVRVRILTRDNWVCQLAYPNCTYRAEQVDHIIPVADLGVSREHIDDSNLQSVCAACHFVKTETHRIAALKASTARRAARRRLPVKPHPGEW